MTTKKAYLINTFIIFFFLFGLLLFLSPSLADAAFGGDIFGNAACNFEDPTSADAEEIQCLLDTVTDWVLGFAGSLTALIIIIGGVRYVISAGNQSQTEAAKKTIVGAIIGLIIVALAKVIVQLVIDVPNGVFN